MPVISINLNNLFCLFVSVRFVVFFKINENLFDKIIDLLQYPALEYKHFEIVSRDLLLKEGGEQNNRAGINVKFYKMVTSDSDFSNFLPPDYLPPAHLRRLRDVVGPSLPSESHDKSVLTTICFDS